MKIENLNFLEAAAAAGRRVFGMGAPVKGNTLLNYFGVDRRLMECVVEKNPLRKGLFTPGTHLPVRMEDELPEPPDVYYVLAWNFKREILANNQELRRRGVEFYFPVNPPETVTQSAVISETEQVAERDGPVMIVTSLPKADLEKATHTTLKQGNAPAGSTRVLVTGATGFLGTVLCHELTRQGNHVTRVNSRSCDLRNPQSLHQFDGQTFDRIFHLAAWTQAGDFCLTHAGEQWVINQQLNTNVLAWWHEQQPEAQLICIGSSCVYDPALELREENYLIGMPTESLFTYAMTKRMLYAGCLALQKQFGHRFLCVVPSTLYGPDYHTDGRQMHFIFDVIRKIVRAKYLGETVTLWGDGWQRRELIHVNDFVSTLLQLLPATDSQLTPDPSAVNLVNIGAGEEFPIRRFAELVCRMVDYAPELIQYDRSRYVGAVSKCLRIERLQNLIPKLHLTSLEEGLRQTVDWFLANKERFLT